MKTKSFILALLFLAGAHISAKNYYASATNGNDANSGLTLPLAKKTIQSATNLTAPGDTVFIANGTYTACPTCDVVTITRSGTASQYIVYINYPGHTPKISFSGWNGISISNSACYIKIIGLEIVGNNANVTLSAALNQPHSCANPSGNYDSKYNGNGISIDGRTNSAHCHHIVISKCTVHDCGGGGIGTMQSDYITVEDNILYNNAWYSLFAESAISLYQLWNCDSGTGYHNYIRRNKCFNNRMYVPWPSANCTFTDGNGIIIDDSKNTQNGSTLGAYNGRTLVENNICWFNGGSGIHAFSSEHVDILNNTAYCNSQTKEINGGQIFPNSSNDVKIYNNILVSDSANVINSNNNNGSVSYFNNLHYNVTPPHTITAPLTNSTCVTGKDALFISAANNLTADFHLKTSSPAIDAGNASVYSTTDFEGSLRPQGSKPDIGAYEYTSLTGIEPATVSSDEILICPNPFSTELSVSISQEIRLQNAVMKIYAICGKEIKATAINSYETTISRGELQNGIYFYSLFNNNKKIASGKLVIQN